MAAGSRSRRSWRVRARGLAAALVGLLPAGQALADEVELVNGDVLVGTIVEQDAATVVIEHPALGRLEIGRDQVRTVKVDAETPPADEEPPAEEPPAPEEAVEEGADEAAEATPEAAPEEKSEIDYWDLALDLSLNSVSGNTDELSLRFGLEAKRETDHTALTADASYFLKFSDDVETDNKLTIGARNDWKFPGSPWFIFLGGRFDWDRFSTFEQRINAQVGPGYRLIDREGLRLDLLGGAGVRKEFEGINTETKFEGLLAVDLAWQATKRQRVIFNFSYFPVLTDPVNDFRTRSTAQWRYAMDPGNYNLALVIGYLWEYQRIVDPTTRPNDFRLWIGIQYGF